MGKSWYPPLNTHIHIYRHTSLPSTSSNRSYSWIQFESRLKFRLLWSLTESAVTSLWPPISSLCYRAGMMLQVVTTWDPQISGLGIRAKNRKVYAILGHLHRWELGFHIPSPSSQGGVKKLPAVSLAPRAPGFEFCCFDISRWQISWHLRNF